MGSDSGPTTVFAIVGPESETVLVSESETDSVSEFGAARLPKWAPAGLHFGDPHLSHRGLKFDLELAILNSPTKPPHPCLFSCLRLGCLYYF